MELMPPPPAPMPMSPHVLGVRVVRFVPDLLGRGVSLEVAGAVPGRRGELRPADGGDARERPGHVDVEPERPCSTQSAAPSSPAAAMYVMPMRFAAVPFSSRDVRVARERPGLAAAVALAHERREVLLDEVERAVVDVAVVLADEHVVHVRALRDSARPLDVEDRLDPAAVLAGRGRAGVGNERHLDGARREAERLAERVDVATARSAAVPTMPMVTPVPSRALPAIPGL